VHEELCGSRATTPSIATDTYGITDTWNGAKNELCFSYYLSFIIFNNFREYRMVSFQGISSKLANLSLMRRRDVSLRQSVI
jgi:hypothetical protein